MFISFRTYIKCFIILSTSVCWCEWLYYHYVIQIECPGWPKVSANMTKILIISDTHIMGGHKSYRIDKWRREWEMHQSFRISTEYFEPNLIINLGDMLDEGSIYDPKNFETSVADYHRTFKSNHFSSKTIYVPGNHDIGPHTLITMYPFFIGRFSHEFNSTEFIELIEINNDISLVVVNSMLLHDECSFCRTTDEILNQMSKKLRYERMTKPILLTHVPLYRPDDTSCDKPLDISQYEDRWEGHEVLSRRKSRLLLESLSPRLVLSGHSHKNCKINHEFGTSSSSRSVCEEITLTSYNHKFDEKPKFLLMSANSTHASTNHCYLISEYHILSVYLASVIVIVVMMIRQARIRNNRYQAIQ